MLLLWPISELFKVDRAARAASQVDKAVKAVRTEHAAFCFGRFGCHLIFLGSFCLEA